MYALTPTSSGSLKLGKELGKGGEGSVFAVEAHGVSGIPTARKLVAKIYHEPSAEERPKKLKAMIANSVQDPAVAWPIAVVVDDQKRFMGYLMNRLESSSYREWLYVANSKDRRTIAPNFDTRYAFAAVRNLAAAIMAVHGVGHRIGDLNESNIFTGADATVLIVDTDSMQVSTRSGEFFPCAVGKPEFTAPELTTGSLRDHKRTRETDIFAFTVAAYQLLTGGATPHQGSFDPNNDDDPLSQVERIRKGILPSLAPQQALPYGFTPRPGVPVGALPEFLKEHFKAFLSPAPELRTQKYNLQTLMDALDRFIPTLEQCPIEKLHWYESNGQTCPWCAEAAASGQDPWGATPTVAPTQAKLKPISFHDSQAPTNSNRAPATVAGPPPAPQPQTPASSSSAAHQQNLVPNNYPAQAAPQAVPATSTPQRPAKIKGKVTVEYADGSWGVRPPLGLLLRKNPKMGFWALKEETPKPLKFWWPVSRDLANPLGLILGLVIGLLTSSLWFWVTGFILSEIPNVHVSGVPALVIASLPVITAMIAVITLFSSGFNDRRVTRKKYGRLDGFKEEKPGKTFLRFIPLVFFYGIPIVIILLFLLIYLLLVFAKAVVRS